MNAPMLSAAAVAAVPTGFLVACGQCELAGGPYVSRIDAERVAGGHDVIHHLGAPTAEISTSGVCESSRTTPATTQWSHPAAGAPFALCARCATDTQHAARYDYRFDDLDQGDGPGASTAGPS